MNIFWMIILFLLSNLFLLRRQISVDPVIHQLYHKKFDPRTLGSLLLDLPIIMWMDFRRGYLWSCSQLRYWFLFRVILWGLSGFSLLGLVPVVVDVVYLGFSLILQSWIDKVNDIHQDMAS